MPSTSTGSAENPPARPRVVLLTLPGLFGAEILRRLAAEPGIELTGVLLSNRLDPRKGWLAGIQEFRRKTGWRYFLYNALLADVSWNWLRATRRPAALRTGTVARLRTNDVNDQATGDWLRQQSPDYVVAYYFNQWIGPEIRATARIACLNVHPSLLPALRGTDPAFRALERDLSRTGLTIHEVVDRYDAGTILHQELVDIPAGSSVFGLFWLLIRSGADSLARYLAGRLSPQIPTPDGTPGDYTSHPSAAEIANFRRRGGVLVRFAEWRQALAEIR